MCVKCQCQVCKKHIVTMVKIVLLFVSNKQHSCLKAGGLINQAMNQLELTQICLKHKVIDYEYMLCKVHTIVTPLKKDVCRDVL